jgi:2-polyprenyl-6-methoxyphenol hydroxylase-like FAD-dependent oxidoreductase
MSEAARVAVLIVGGGPVGLSLAVDLGWRGIDCLLVEQRDGAVDFPKMNMVSSRSMEFCRRWGMAEQVKQVGWPDELPLNVAFVTSMTGYELARFDYPGYRDRGELSHTPEGSRRCPQTLFDPILRDQADAMPSVTLEYRTQLETFEQDDAGVRVGLLDLETGDRREVAADYLVGCDGAASAVRDKLGIAMLGDPALTHNINVFFLADEVPGWREHGNCWANWIVGPEGQWGNVLAVDGHHRWRLSMTGFAQDAIVTHDEIAARIRRAVGVDFDFEIVAALPWVRRRQVAERYGDGRVFIAGDAAHLLSPTGGFGMNTGMGDAIDLSWKLAAAVDGWAGPGLLASYEAERRPIGAANVEEATRNFKKIAALPAGPEIESDSPAGAALRVAIRDAILAGGYRQEYEAEGLIMGYRYDASPIIWPEAGAPPASTVSSYVPTTAPGARAPHGWLPDRRSTLDLFGKGFTLLRFDAAVSCAGLVAAAEARGVPLTVHDIAAPEIAALYETALVLVRPDGHVAWRGAAAADDPDAVIDVIRGASLAEAGRRAAI